MKKILTLIFLLYTMVLFVSCGVKENTEITTETIETTKTIEATESKPLTDEEQIQDSIASYFDQTYNREAMEQYLISEIFGDFVDEGEKYDYSKLVNGYMKHLSYKLEDIIINGDNATAKFTLITLNPSEDFFNQMSDELEPAATERFGTSDLSTVDEKEYHQFLIDYMGEYFDSHEVEESSNTEAISIHKENDVWTVE